MKGKFIIFSAPSGAGKTTLVKHLLDSGLPLEFSISATSRAPRGKETDGKDYYFLTTQEFKNKIDAEEFIEWEEVYEGSFYGTLKSEIQRIWDNGHHVIFDIDVIGGINLKRLYPEITFAVFVMPPSVEELEKRLIARSTDDLDTINKRIAKSVKELQFADKFDVVVVNDNLEEAKKKAYQIVSEFINS